MSLKQSIFRKGSTLRVGNPAEATRQRDARRAAESAAVCLACHHTARAARILRDYYRTDPRGNGYWDTHDSQYAHAEALKAAETPHTCSNPPKEITA